MKSSSTWVLAPARLAPASLDPRPVKNENSSGFPTTTDTARAYAMEIKSDRAKRLPWRVIAEKLSISRIEAIRLAHSLDEVLDDIRESALASEPVAAHRRV
ncbi:hypothetical protein [Arthrobacter sp. UYCo732]|uniref:hypothetical protein n=1 Tax=Arthrobacter sp. UYCo732 TaxID=3156336 RepID=UPI003390E7FC